MALTAAETGLLVFATLHTNSAAKAVDRIIDAFPAIEQEQIRIVLAESLRAVVAQQLLRKKVSGRVPSFEILLRSEEHTSELQSLPTRRSSDLWRSPPPRRVSSSSRRSTRTPPRKRSTGSSTLFRRSSRNRSGSCWPSRSARSSPSSCSGRKSPGASPPSRSSSDRKSTRLNSSHSLHDALPIYGAHRRRDGSPRLRDAPHELRRESGRPDHRRFSGDRAGTDPDRAGRVAPRGRRPAAAPEESLRARPLLRDPPQIGRAHV